jgi:phosphatidylglycerophosphatase A
VSPLDRVRWCLITGCGLGTSPFAPGTVGTLGGTVLAVSLQWALPDRYLSAWAIAFAVLCVYGCLESKFVARTWPNKDPGQFVLDEITGYLVTVLVYALLRQRAPDHIDHMAAFFAFRVFDVLKPQPCRRLEDIPGAPGIMADDQVAGVYAGLAMWLVLPLLGL